MGRRVQVDGIESQVRDRRRVAGLSQAVLAGRAGLTRQTVSAIEAGQYIPNTAVALRLARALDCAVEALFALPALSEPAEAELLDAEPFQTPSRVRLARVGGRLLARPLTGNPGALTPADGLALRAPHAGSRVSVDLLVQRELIDNTVVVAGCDPALALLGGHLARRHPALRLLWVEAGSLTALRALGRGEAHAAGTHLVDPDTGEANLPFVRRELAGRGLLLVTLCQWQQGLIIARGNPKGIREAADLARPDVTIINREAGSGSRGLLDSSLNAASVPVELVTGYQREVLSHMAVAGAIASGMADAGPGIMAAARAFGLDFIPLREERYDLVISAEHLDTPPVQALLEAATSPACRAEVEALGGYDSSMAGTVVAQMT